MSPCPAAERRRAPSSSASLTRRPGSGSSGRPSRPDRHSAPSRSSVSVPVTRSPLRSSRVRAAAHTWVRAGVDRVRAELRGERRAGHGVQEVPVAAVPADVRGGCRCAVLAADLVDVQSRYLRYAAPQRVPGHDEVDVQPHQQAEQLGNGRLIHLGECVVEQISRSDMAVFSRPDSTRQRRRTASRRTRTGLTLRRLRPRV